MIPVFDAHCDTVYRCVVEQKEAHFSGTGGHWDLNRMGNLSPLAQFFAVFWDSEKQAQSGQTAQTTFDRYYVTFQKELARLSDKLAFCRTAEEADAAFARGQGAAFLSVEGGELLDCSLSRLEEAYKLGVRAVNLTWNHANALSGSHCDQPERGLSDQGKAFVSRMQDLGMLVDVSHLSDPGFWDVLEQAEKPVMASHSNSRAAHFHTRNLTDGQFTAIIKNGGIVGLNLCPSFLGEEPVKEEQLFAHIEHFLDLGGEHTLALGGDWDGISHGPAGYNGIWDWEKLYEGMMRRNYSETLIRGIFFDNLMRVVRQVCTT
jgi:membrane dipeptidase